MAEARNRHATIEIDRRDASPTVLVVDDDADIRSAIQEYLQDEGFTVVPAADGADALNTLRTAVRPDVILLDILMPGMDGWDFRAAQLADPALQEIPVIVISASGFVPDTIRRQLDAHTVLSKPLELDRFLMAVREACRLEADEQTSSNSA
jgi:CheY-like chemotaxis protein